MAIDSALKRASIAAIGLSAIGPTVIPSGAFDQADRQVIGYSYAGVLAGSPSSLEIRDDALILIQAEDRTIVIAAENRIITII